MQSVKARDFRIRQTAPNNFWAEESYHGIFGWSWRSISPDGDRLGFTASASSLGVAEKRIKNRKEYLQREDEFPLTVYTEHWDGRLRAFEAVA